jgi:hypothetical protein
VGEFFITIFLFFAVAAITFVIFAGWGIVLGFKALGRMIGNLFVPLPQSSMRCANQICGQVNPASAQFCRRCGRALRTRLI